MINYKFRVLPKPTFVAKNEIQLHSEDIDRLELVNYLFVIVNFNGNEVKCLLQANDEVPKKSVLLSKRVFDNLDLKYGDGNTNELILFEVLIYSTQFEPVNRGIPMVDDVGNDAIKACPKLIEKYSNQVEIFNSQNGYRMLVKLISNIDAKESTVYLDRYTMLLLGADNKNKKQIQLYISKVDGFKQNSDWNIYKFIKKTLRFIGGIFIGSRQLSLRVAYLYPFDEHNNIGRLHPNTRKLLGIEQTDKVEVIYNGRKIVLPILDFDTGHMDPAFKLEDEFIDSHLLIGIPAISRHKLQIPNIGTIITVQRRMPFILKKHLNKLILPTIGLCFSLSQIPLKLSYLILIFTILFILIVYTSLSEERSKTSK